MTSFIKALSASRMIQYYSVGQSGAFYSSIRSTACLYELSVCVVVCFDLVYCSKMELKPRQVITLTLWYSFGNLQMQEVLHTEQSLLKDRTNNLKKNETIQERRIFEG